MYDCAVLGSGLTGLVVSCIFLKHSRSFVTLSLKNKERLLREAEADVRLLNISRSSMQFLREGLSLSLAEAFPVRKVVFYKHQDRLFHIGEEVPLSWMVPYHTLFKEMMAKLPDVCVDDWHALEPQDEHMAVLGSNNQVRSSRVLFCDGKNSLASVSRGKVVYSGGRYSILAGFLTLSEDIVEAQEYFWERGVFTVLPTGKKKASFVWHVDAELSMLQSWSESTLVELLNQKTVNLKIDAITNIRFWDDFRSFHAQSFSFKGGGVIGDAAFAVLPLAGQGFNVTLNALQQLYNTPDINWDIWSDAYFRQVQKLTRRVNALDSYLRGHRCHNLVLASMRLGSLLGVPEHCAYRIFV